MCEQVQGEEHELMDTPDWMKKMEQPIEIDGHKLKEQVLVVSNETLGPHVDRIGQLLDDSGINPSGEAACALIALACNTLKALCVPRDVVQELTGSLFDACKMTPEEQARIDLVSKRKGN